MSDGYTKKEYAGCGGCGCATILVLVLVCGFLGNTDWVQWSAAEREDTVEAYGEYLEKKPKGRHRYEAEKRIAEMEVGLALPPSAKQASLQELMAQRKAVGPAPTKIRFFPKFYVADEKGEKAEFLDDMGSSFRTKFVAETLEEARTIIFVQKHHRTDGHYETPFLREKRGEAVVHGMYFHIIDTYDTTRARWTSAEVTPAERIVNGAEYGAKTRVDGRTFDFSCSHARIVELLVEGMVKRGKD